MPCCSFHSADSHAFNLHTIISRSREEKAEREKERAIATADSEEKSKALALAQKDLDAKREEMGSLIADNEREREAHAQEVARFGAAIAHLETEAKTRQAEHARERERLTTEAVRAQEEMQRQLQEEVARSKLVRAEKAEAESVWAREKEAAEKEREETAKENQEREVRIARSAAGNGCDIL